MLSYTVVKKKNMKESSIQGSSGLFVKNTDSQKLSPDTCPIPDSCDAIKDLLKRIDQKFLMSDEVQHDENKSPPSESLQDVEKKATDKKKHKISTAKSSVKTQSLQPSEIQMKNSKAKTPKGFEFEPIKIDEYGFFRCISKSIFILKDTFYYLLKKLDDSPFTASEMKINLFKHKPIKVEDPVVEQPSPPKISALREDKYKHNTQNTNKVKNMKETSQNGIVCQKSVKPSQGPKRVQDYSNVQKLEKGKNKYINNKSSNVGNAEKPCVETTSVNYMTHHYKSRSSYGHSSRNSNFRKTDSNFLPHPNNLNVSDNYLRQPQPIRIEPSVSVKETNIQAKSPKKSSQVKHDDKDDVNKIITWSEVSNDTCEVGSEKTCEIDKKDRIPEAETNLRGRSQYPSNRRGNRGRRPRYNYDRGAASASVPFTTFVDMVDQYGQIYTVPVVPFLYYVPVLPSNNPGGIF
ncbi:hypothetical protein RF11_12031 [Thelohanellus kitauei]|uniref:Uncharacterized protein n=1 Tax=Thelohanellus kitauei TaxID=669202 RepID=A0A0C2MPD6_THEKT|nr:hypothetical protein RF11_12031 [Thelohanellus kitauei]